MLSNSEKMKFKDCYPNRYIQHPWKIQQYQTHVSPYRAPIPTDSWTPPASTPDPRTTTWLLNWHKITPNRNRRDIRVSDDTGGGNSTYTQSAGKALLFTDAVIAAVCRFFLGISFFCWQPSITLLNCNTNIQKECLTCKLAAFHCDLARDVCQVGN